MPADSQRTLGLRIKLLLRNVNDTVWFVCYCGKSYPILTDCTPMFHTKFGVYVQFSVEKQIRDSKEVKTEQNKKEKCPQETSLFQLTESCVPFGGSVEQLEVSEASDRPRLAFHFSHL